MPAHPAPAGAEGSTAQAINAAERSGLRLALAIRAGLLVALMSFSILSQPWPQGLVGAVSMLPCLLLGLAFAAAVRRRVDTAWMRYGFLALDAFVIALAAVTMPLTTGGDVPQIVVFRVYGVDVFFFVLALSALSLSPALVLWTGGCAIAAIWGAWLTIVAGMDRTLTWADLPPSSSAEVFLRTFLDADFTARGNRIVETILLAATAAVLAAAVSRARTLLARRLAAERARSAVAEVFGRFVPEEVADRLAANGGQLPAERRTASVLFVDIAGFTRFAEDASPEVVVSALDAFFATVSETVAERSGVVISLIGDAALAAFNAPLDNASHATDALGAAERLMARVAAERYAGQHFRVRIGVATGPVAAGTVGGRGRRAYTLYGDTVNLAQRLEARNKDGRTVLTVDAATWESAGRPAGYLALADLTVPGRAGTIGAYARAAT